MRIIRRGDLRPTPWKNGGGVTSDIVMVPDGATRETFTWRMSLAEGADCAPFSSYPDVDRTMVWMEGGHLMLDFGAGTVVLGPETRPLSYPGEAPVIGWLDAGPAVVLNVMSRRAMASHRVMVMPVDGPRPLPAAGRAVVCRSGRIAVDGEPLNACDTALLTGGQAASLVSGAGTAVVVFVDDMDRMASPVNIRPDLRAADARPDPQTGGG